VPREYPRARRIEEQLKRLLSDLVRREVKDPRVGLITITSAEVSGDLTHATGVLHAVRGHGRRRRRARALQHAAGFLRHQVRNQMRLRVAPELVFRIDDSVERGARLSALIHDASRATAVATSTTKAEPE
jgi:ribosome-binding factor A